MTNPKVAIGGGILAVAFILVASFVLYNTWDLLFGQPLVIGTPQDGEVVHSPVLPVTGHISHAARISLNGAQILTDDKGVFSKIVVLHPGLNVLEVAAADRFNREERKTLRVVYQP